MLKSSVFTLIEGISQMARASYSNGHIPHAQQRAFARALTQFELFGKSGPGHVVISPFTFNYADPKAFAYNFREVFLEEEYFFKSDTAGPVIIDCGSNIGLATMYFKMIFPDALVTAIEANPSTFAILEKNVRSNDLSGVEILNLAVTGDDETDVSLMFADAGDLRATRMKELYGETALPTQEVKVPARRLSTILPASVDLLKMDIEGSEHDVIDEISSRLGSIKNVIIEYHYSPGGERRSLGDFITVLERAGFICRIKSANPADINFVADSNYVATIYGSRVI